jgi:hypothetical protein
MSKPLLAPLADGHATVAVKGVLTKRMLLKAHAQ